jgi:hypothetical protein
LRCDGPHSKGPRKHRQRAALEVRYIGQHHTLLDCDRRFKAIDTKLTDRIRFPEIQNAVDQVRLDRSWQGGFAWWAENGEYPTDFVGLKRISDY